MNMAIEMSETNPVYALHAFGKSNLVSNKDGSDTYKCSKCGLAAKRPMLSEILEMKGSLSYKKVYMCDGTVLMHDVDYKGPTGYNAVDSEFESKLIQIIDDTQIPFDTVKIGDIFSTIDPKSKECVERAFDVKKDQVAINAEDNNLVAPLKLLAHEFSYI